VVVVVVVGVGGGGGGCGCFFGSFLLLIVIVVTIIISFCLSSWLELQQLRRFRVPTRLLPPGRACVAPTWTLWRPTVGLDMAWS
jgi:hypothetical protein